jgi:hypothetical protein
MLIAAMCLLAAAIVSTYSAFSNTTDSSSSSFSSAASFCSPFTPFWMTGVESGAIAGVSGNGLLDSVSQTGGSAITADNTVSRSGNYSLKLVKANGGDGYARIPYMGTPNVVVGRVAVRFQTLPSVLTPFMLAQGTAGSGAVFNYNNTSQKLTVDLGGTVVSSSMTVSAGRWYVLDFRVTFNTNPRTVDWRVDGVAQTQVSLATTASTSNGIVQIGEFSNSNAYTVYYDDIAVTTSSATYPLPSGSIRSIVPDGVTAVTDASSRLKDDAGTAVTNGGSLWNRLDETPMTSTTDFMKQIGNDSNAYAQLSFGDVTSTGCVDAANGVLAYHSSNATGASGKTAVWESGTERTIYNSTMNPGASLRYQVVRISPSTGDWTAAKLTGATARLGYSPTATATNYAAWDAVRVEYEQIPDAATDYANTVLADNPSGYWRLGELSGTAAAAASGSPAGTYTNAPTLGVGGGVGDTDTAVRFDGSNDYMTLGDSFDLVNNSTFTIECWVNPAAAATASYPEVFGKYTASGGWWLYLEGSAEGTPNAATFERIGSAGSDHASTGAASLALPVNTWSHVAVTYDGTDVRIYLNGVLRDTTTSSRTVPNTAIAATLGGDPGTTAPFNGRLDEAAIYPTALSQARIQAHYDAGKP